MTRYGVLEFTEARLAPTVPGVRKFVAEQAGPIWICPISVTAIRPAYGGMMPGVTRISTDGGEAFMVFADPVDVAEQVSMYHQERDAL